MITDDDIRRLFETPATMATAALHEDCRIALGLSQRKRRSEDKAQARARIEAYLNNKGQSS